MSKSFIKLLDNALLPAALMVVSKFVGVFFTIKIFNLEWATVQVPNNFLSFQTVLSSQDVVLVTSYSYLFMFVVLAIGFTVSILRAVFLHNSHISSDILNRLASKNLLTLITNSYEIYHSATVWLFFMWISAILIVNDVLLNNVYSWVGAAVLIIGILLSLIYFQDVYKEIEHAKKNPGKYLNS